MMYIKNIHLVVFSIFLMIGNTTSYGQSITVNSTNYKQTIDMIGGDMERSSSAIQSATNKNDILQWSFGDIDFNVCRVQYDKKQELEEGVKNWAFYNNQVKTMQAIKAINPEIKFFGTMRSDYDGYGDDNNMPDWIHNYNTKVTNTQKYGVFLADYCEYMSNQGVPISILSTAKEWMWHVRASEAEEIINTMYGELEDRGIEKPMIIDQGFWSISAGLTYLKDVGNLGTKDMYTGFCSHNYANEDPEKWVEITEKAVALGKPMYDDETSTGSGSPTYGVEREMYKQIGEYIKKAQRYEAGLSGEVYFEIWSRGIDKETRSIYFPNKGKGKRLRGYYMMKHFSNNVLGYTYVTSAINEATDVYTITFRKDDEIVLWVINKGDNEYTLPIQMDESTITSKVATHYWTDHTPVEGADTTYIASGNTFVPEIKGESMSCFIFDVTENEVDACSTLNTNLLEAECNDAMSGISLQESTEGTAYVTDINHGDWIAFNQVDFGNGQDQFAARVSSNTTGGNIEVRLNSVDGDLLGTLAVSNTLGTQNWTTLSTDIIETTGIQNIYLKFTGSGDQMFHVNWVGFQKEPSAINLETSSANSSVVLNWSLDNVTLGTQNLYRNTFFAEDGKTLIAENIKEYNYVDNNVSNGETYWYWLEVVDSENNTVKSNVLEITPSIPNLALASNGCVATQSTTGWSGFAELAIDGNTDGNFNNGSVTHTSADAVADPEPWWQVDLKKDYTINVIDIYNRTGNSYGDRLNNFTVEVKDKAGNVTYSQFYETQPDPPLLSIQVGGVLGSVVKISKTSNTALSLAEVQVYGDSNKLSNAAFSNNKEIQVYSNPVANNFTITNCKDAVLEFYTVLGTLVSKSNVDTNQQSVDVSGFKKGVYFVKINQKGVITQIKIIKN